MMPELGKYAFAVLTSYGVSAVLLAALIGVSWLQARRAKTLLDEIERRTRSHDA